VGQHHEIFNVEFGICSFHLGFFFVFFVHVCLFSFQSFTLNSDLLKCS